MPITPTTRTIYTDSRAGTTFVSGQTAAFRTSGYPIVVIIQAKSVGFNFTPDSVTIGEPDRVTKSGRSIGAPINSERCDDVQCWMYLVKNPALGTQSIDFNILANGVTMTSLIIEVVEIVGADHISPKKAGVSNEEVDAGGLSSILDTITTVTNRSAVICVCGRQFVTPATNDPRPTLRGGGGQTVGDVLSHKVTDMAGSSSVDMAYTSFYFLDNLTFGSVNLTIVQDDPTHMFLILQEFGVARWGKVKPSRQNTYTPVDTDLTD